MRTILILCAVILIAGGFYAKHAMQLPSHYGEFSGSKEVPVEEVLNRPQTFLGKTVTVRGTITEQCKTMGCYFFFATPKGKLRVELKDIAMNAPMHEGGPARVEGQIVTYTDGYQLYASAIDFE